MNAQAMMKEERETDRPHLEIVRPGAADVIELRALPRVTAPRPTLSMAGVTSGLQLLLAARRAARISTALSD